MSSSTEGAEKELEQLGIRAQKLFREKGSYDVSIDARVAIEYERAYELIQYIAAKYAPPRE
jgi:hypothetical protein